MCHRRHGLLLLVLALAASTASSFLLPSPAPARPRTTTSASSSSSVDRRDALGVLATTLAIPTFLMSTPTRSALAADPSAVEEALTRVLVVRDSTAQLEDELTNGGTYPDVKALVTSLIKNYRLKDSLSSSLSLATAKTEAETHAKLAFENLIIVLEYFPEDQSGPLQNKTLKPDQLQFTIKALQATRKELNAFLNAFPSDLVTRLGEAMAAT